MSRSIFQTEGDMRKKTICVVCSSKPDCPDTIRALMFLMRRVKNARIQLLKQDSKAAKRLWVAAEMRVAGKTGHPLVCVVDNIGDDLEIDSARVEPNDEELAALVTAGGYKLYTPDALPDIAEIIVGV